MTRTIACTVSAAVAALALAAAATAKGPSEATVTGPGIRTVTFGGGETSGSAAMDLAMNAGFFQGAYGADGSPATQARPAGTLGPKYAIRYVVPNGTASPNSIRQSLYPYARRGAVTFMPAGQKIFDMRTIGGWYRGGAALKRVLVAHGLPRKAPSVHSRRPATGWIVAGLAVVGLAAAGGLARRK